MKNPMELILAEIMAQPPAERVDYAVDLMAFYLVPNPAFFDGCIAMGIDLSPGDMRVLLALYQRAGHTVAPDALMAARHVDEPADDWPTNDAIVKAISRIKRELDRAAVPLTVENWHDLGYLLRVPPGFSFEAAAPADLFRHVGEIGR